MKGEFPNWTVLNNISCEAIDMCRVKLSDILYKKYFTEKIDFVILENFLSDLKEFTFCSGKINLLTGIAAEALNKVEIEKLANSIADFVESGGSAKDAKNVINLFSNVVEIIRENENQTYLDFLHMLDNRVDNLIFAAKSSDDRNRILDITFRIK